jgi:sulfate adenylyltransferase large subunit
MTVIAKTERETHPSLSEASFGRELIRFNTAGSVDNGKSTLIGRLLYDSGGLPEDVIKTIAARSRDGGKLNLAAFTDGLKAERERAITIDASYRYFQRGERDFIVADSPGHFEYTRNMLTATSHSDATLILVDAEHGIVEQNRRHAYLASMAGVKNIAILVNKLDLFDYSRARFDEIQGEFSRLLEKLPDVELTYIPISALHGENIVQSSRFTPWFEGPSVLGYLEGLSPERDVPVEKVRAVVQWIEREERAGHREVVVRLDEGSLVNGDRLRSSPGDEEVSVEGLSVPSGFVVRTSATQARFQVPWTSRLQRGDILSRAETPLSTMSRFDARICWMDERPLREGERYLVRIGGKLTEGVIERVDRRVDIGTYEHIDDRRALTLNEVGVVTVSLARPIAAVRFSDDRRAGALIVIDPGSGHTVAAGGVLTGNKARQ